MFSLWFFYMVVLDNNIQVGIYVIEWIGLNEEIWKKLINVKQVVQVRFVSDGLVIGNKGFCRW